MKCVSKSLLKLQDCKKEIKQFVGGEGGCTVNGKDSLRSMAGKL